MERTKMPNLRNGNDSTGCAQYTNGSIDTPMIFSKPLPCPYDYGCDGLRDKDVLLLLFL